MLLLKLLSTWLAVTAVLVILHRCGITVEDHEHGASGGDSQGCLNCPSAGTCQTAQPAPRTRTNQEERS